MPRSPTKVKIERIDEELEQLRREHDAVQARADQLMLLISERLKKRAEIPPGLREKPHEHRQRTAIVSQMFNVIAAGGDRGVSYDELRMVLPDVKQNTMYKTADRMIAYGLITREEVTTPSGRRERRMFRVPGAVDDAYAKYAREQKKVIPDA